MAREQRKPVDFYPTPISVVTAMIDRFLSLKECPVNTVWEPCSGDGRIATELRRAGIDVIETDIMSGEDFFAFDTVLSSVVITNPPFKHIREFIDHAFSIGVTDMALVCNERLWACNKGQDQFKRHKPDIFANMSWREDYLGKGGSPDRALAVAIWLTSQQNHHCEYEIWSRPDGKKHETATT